MKFTEQGERGNISKTIGPFTVTMFQEEGEWKTAQCAIAHQGFVFPLQLGEPLQAILIFEDLASWIRQKTKGEESGSGKA